MSSGPRLLLDTHIWVNYQNGSADFSSSTKDAVESAAHSGSVYISVISVWEVALLVRLRRLSLHTSVDKWTAEALSKPGINLLPLTPEIAIHSVDLPEPMHKDPADRILVASARVEHLTLMTRDRDILAFASSTRLACIPA